MTAIPDKWEEVEKLKDRGALFVVSHSGGKDSQAMYLAMRKVIPKDQLLIIYARLKGGVVWRNNWKHIENTIDGATKRMVADAYWIDGAEKSLLEMWHRRGKGPGVAGRYCTSDLKTQPINREIRRLINGGAWSNKLVVMCLGLRAEESGRRADESKTPTLSLDKGQSKAGREWYRWCPIKSWSAKDVFKVINQAGQDPHWVYDQGMRRCSCIFCIFSCPKDVRTAAKLRPDLYSKMAQMEKELSWNWMPKNIPIEEYAQLSVPEAWAESKRVSRGELRAGVPVGLCNPYGDGDLESIVEACDEFVGELEPIDRIGRQMNLI